MSTPVKTYRCIHHIDNVVLSATYQEGEDHIGVSYNGGAPFHHIALNGESVEQPSDGLPVDLDYTHKKIANIFVTWCESMTKRELVDRYIRPIAA